MASVRFLACWVILLHLTSLNIAMQWGSLHQSETHKMVVRSVADQYTPTGKDETALKWYEFDQKLDHFHHGSIETWKQRYLVDMTSYSGEETIFLNIEGEGEADIISLGNDTMIAQYAEKFGAAKFSLEHRFYGYSRPKPDLTIESLKYLSIQQALADLAYFITKMNEKHGFSNPKWIVFGCSYAANLATWLRYKYPHLVYGAVASSAPILAIVDFHESSERVAESLAITGGQQCVDAIKAANIEMSEAMSNSAKRKEFQDLFRLCDPLESNEKDISRFFGLQITMISAYVSLNYDNASINQDICAIMNNKTIGNPVHRYAELNKYFLKQQKWNKQQCWNHTYSNLIADLRDTSFHVSEDVLTNGPRIDHGRQWCYQKCTEVGYLTPSRGKNDTFGYTEPLKLQIDVCSDMFDSRFNESLLYQGVETTNTFYGGLSPAVTRVIFVNGSQDRWSALGITSNPPQGSYAVYINGTSHCMDAWTRKEDDRIPQLIAARSKIMEIIGKWVSEKNQPGDSKSAFHF